MLVDTGAEVTMFPWSVFDGLAAKDRPALEPSDVYMQAGNKTPITVYGMARLTMKLGDYVFEHKIYIVEDIIPAILGADLLEAHDWGMVGKKEKRTLVLDGDKMIRVYDYYTSKSLSSKITLNRTIVIRPGEQVVTMARVARGAHVEYRPSVIEPARSSYVKTGAMVARIMVTPIHRQVPVRILNPYEEPIRMFRHTTVGLLQDVTEATVWDNPCADEERELVTVNKNTQLEGETQTVTAAEAEPEVDADRPRVELDVNQDSEQFNTDALRHLSNMYKRAVEGLAYQESRKVRLLFMDFPDIFARHKQDFGKTSMTKHEIDTGNEPPVKQRPRRIPRAHVPELQRQVKSLADKGVIRPSSSSWASNVLLVKKKDGTFRMCIDYRALNAKTKSLDEYVLPRIDDTLDALSRAKYFCTLDLIQGYHQVELAEDAKEKTAFLAPQCNPTQWEFDFMPFGLVGAPRTFQKMMDRLLKGLEYIVALAYLDDIIVFGTTLDECINNVRLVFQRVRDAGLKLKPDKCSFFRPETLYLGHVVSAEGVRCDPEKIEAIRKWHRPRTTRQVRSFLGMTNYYRKFIKNYADLSHPLYALLKKSKKFQWEKEEDAAFERLKESLMSTPVMAFPQAEGTYILDTDASAYAIGGVLSQLQQDENGEWQERVIAYGSRTLIDREKRYCARRRELLAIVEYVKHFNAYLRGPRFVIRTDHASLRYVKTLREMPDQFARWIMFLENYNYEIQVRKGTLHVNADALSRYICEGKGCICDGVVKLDPLEGGGKDENDPADHHEPGLVTFNAFKFKPQWSDEEMASAQKADSDIGIIYQAFVHDRFRPRMNDVMPYSAATKALYMEWSRLEVHRGMLYRRWESNDGEKTVLQLVIPHRFQQTLCRLFHDSRRGAHLGRRRVTAMLHAQMYWYKMREVIRTWIQTCDVCQRRKRPAKTPRAPMQVFTAGFCNERVAMDVCGPLTPSRDGNTLLLVIADCFSKFTKGYPMKDQTARTIAELLTQHWVNEYGEPHEIHSDQGRNFESQLMKEVCELHGIAKTRTTPYHPQGDGQVERTNQTVMQMASTLAGSYLDWDLKVGTAISAYNSTIHATTGFTPNRLWFGREIIHSADAVLPENPATLRLSREQYVQRLERDNHIAYQVARDHTRRAVKTQKKYHDRFVNFNRYKEGDMVLLKRGAKPAKGTSKLADRWLGPYYIIDVLSDVDFRIARFKEDARRVQHHDRLRPFMKRDGVHYDNSWVFDISRTFRRGRVESSQQTDNTVPRADNQPGADTRATGSQGEVVVTPPAAHGNDAPATRQTVQTQTDPAPELVVAAQPPPKRRRGRPKKVVLPPAADAPRLGDDTDTAASARKPKVMKKKKKKKVSMEKRKPGRPRKYPLQNQTVVNPVSVFEGVESITTLYE